MAWNRLKGQANLLTDTELVYIFMETLQSLNYEKIVWSSSSNVVDLVIIEVRIESGLKKGKIVDGGSQ